KTRARNAHMLEQVIIDIESSEEEKDHATKGTHETNDYVEILLYLPSDDREGEERDEGRGERSCHKGYS
ncbi:hypothetical protein GOP47_0005967, partial [Adiantum capillus-veneris]